MILTRKKCEAIATRWNLGKVHSLKKLHGGLQTPKMLAVTDAGMFVISRHNLSEKKILINKSPRSFLYELELLALLEELPVPYFVRSSSGKYLERLGGDWITVDAYIEGNNPTRITPRMAKQLGVFLGAFHLRGARFRKTLVGRRKFYDLPFALVGGMMKHVVRQKNKKLKTIVEEVRDGVLRTRPPRGLPRGPIHVDIKPENELWKDEKLSAVLDFGNFYVDAYMIDVGKTIMWNCLREGKLSRALVRAFLKGYESKRRLTTKEREYLPRSVLFAIYSHIFVDLYHVPLGYVPESYTLSLVQDFLPVARTLEREAL